MGKKTYDAIDVANYTINYCIDENVPVSNLKLQKLLYYIQAASIVECNKKMFRENISAWKYGPVVENVYHNFKWYVDKKITEKVTERDRFFDFYEESEYDPSKILLGADKVVVNKVVDSYKNYSALGMVKKTHEEAPWKNAYENNNDYISIEAMRSFYGKEDNKSLIYGK